MTLYNEETPSRDGRQITFPDSIDFIIQAMAAGSVIFDETGEIRVLASRGGASRKKTYLPRHLKPPCDQNTSRAPVLSPQRGAADMAQIKVLLCPGLPCPILPGVSPG